MLDPERVGLVRSCTAKVSVETNATAELPFYSCTRKAGGSNSPSRRLGRLGWCARLLAVVA